MTSTRAVAALGVTLAALAFLAGVVLTEMVDHGQRNNFSPEIGSGITHVLPGGKR